MGLISSVSESEKPKFQTALTAAWFAKTFRSEKYTMPVFMGAMPKLPRTGTKSNVLIKNNQIALCALIRAKRKH